MGEQRRDMEWEAVSHMSSRGEVNILRGAPRGAGPGMGGLPPRGGDASPTQRERQQPWEGGGDNVPGAITQNDARDNVPRAITQNNAIDIQSNISLGEAGDGLRGQGEREDPAQQPTNETRGGGISMVLNAAVQKMTTATIERELNWQSRVEGDAAKVTAFKEQVMNQHAFRAFAFMKGKSPAIHMAHSIGAFYGLSGMAIKVQGKQIAFVGDRINGRQPIPFILPPQNSWTWA